MYYQLNILNYSCDHCFLAHPKHFSFDVRSSRGFLTVMTTFDPPGFSDFCFICSYGPTKCINGVSGLNVRSHSKEKSSEIPGCAKEKFIDILYRPLFSRENPGKDNCSYLLPWTSFLLGGQGNYSDLLPLIRTAWWQSVSTPLLKKTNFFPNCSFHWFCPRCSWVLLSLTSLSMKCGERCLLGHVALPFLKQMQSRGGAPYHQSKNVLGMFPLKTVSTTQDVSLLRDVSITYVTMCWQRLFISDNEWRGGSHTQGSMTLCKRVQ